jgi:D-lyxose ketol-isomerase
VHSLGLFYVIDLNIVNFSGLLIILRLIMQRSEINRIIEQAIDFFKQMQFVLPPFAYYSITDWKEVILEAREIFDLGLGWDITDFGLGEFEKKGLLLFTIRNGQFGGDQYPKPYAEKIMIVGDGQITPLHFHWNKMEDIINRGGGDLVFELFNSNPDEELAKTPVQISVDGLKRTVNPGEQVVLQPGQSLLLAPYLYHKFYGKNGRVLVGEVSMVNDDATDNRFYDPVGRFPDIEEDIQPKYLLCNDYKKFINAD